MRDRGLIMVLIPVRVDLKKNWTKRKKKTQMRQMKTEITVLSCIHLGSLPVCTSYQETNHTPNVMATPSNV